MTGTRRWSMAAVLAVGVVSTAPVRASTVKAPLVRAISGPSPFAPDGCGLSTRDQGSEYSPAIAVNPANRRNFVAVFSQDREISTVVAATRDGGRHWTQVLVPGLSQCTGGTSVDAFDPSVSIGSDGMAYLSSAVDEHFDFSRVLASRSTDRGLTWSEPVTVDQAGPFPISAIDFPVLTADPHLRGTAYLVWSRILFASLTSPQFFSRTTDGGITWSSPAEIPIAPEPGRTAFGSQLLVLPDGTLVDVFVEVRIDPQPGTFGVPVGPTGVWAVRSEDRGDSWSAPISVAGIPANVVTDPDTGTGLGRGRSDEIPSVAVGSGGTLYAVWHVIESPSSSQILLVGSVDGGLTWTAPTPVATRPTQAFKPTVAVSPSGTIGVTYFDFRGDVPGDADLTTDLWFVHSHDRGATWSETHVAGPFDVRPAPSPGSFPLGDSFGLAPIGRSSFAATFVQTITPATEGSADVFFSRLRVRPRRVP